MRATLLDWVRRRSRVEANTHEPGEGLAAVSESRRITPFAAEPWYLDHLTVTGNGLYVFGWSILADAPDKPVNGCFMVNGQSFDELRYPFPRPDIGGIFWMHERSELSGFEGKIEHLSEPYPDGLLEVQRVRANRQAIERGRDSWFRPDPARHTDLPDEDRRFRVIGERDPNAFLCSGATDYHRLDRAVLEFSGRHLHEFEHVLDWGVGCGRIARHVPSASAAALTGCDIDHDNVDWCQGHLPGTFVSCTMDPPLPFASESFDLIYGVSIFTHLREAMQLRWLEELLRVLVRGGIVLVTVHGQTAIDFSHHPHEEYWRLSQEVKQKGMVMIETNPQLDGHADHAGEYVNVLHSAEYIRRVWGEYFRVEHILAGYILHHDLVVLRKA
jgi:SAM-dependent methyltransferase